MADMVKMTHPELGEAGPVSRAAFDNIWEPKGWKVQDPEAAPARKGRTKRGAVSDG